MLISKSIRHISYFSVWKTPNAAQRCVWSRFAKFWAFQTLLRQKSRTNAQLQTEPPPIPQPPPTQPLLVPLHVRHAVIVKIIVTVVVVITDHITSSHVALYTSVRLACTNVNQLTWTLLNTPWTPYLALISFILHYGLQCRMELSKPWLPVYVFFSVRNWEISFPQCIELRLVLEKKVIF